jgi:predicted ATP-grasp superfamily ATP-dependent carboligase
MHQLATKHGIPTAATVCPVSRDDVEEFLEGTSFPIVLKGTDPYAGHLPTKVIAQSRDELMQVVDREAARGPLNFILQEYIPGGADTVWMCNAYFGLRPEHTVIFTGKKLRQVSDTGIASLAICLPNDTVAEQTRRFMEDVGYRGCVGIGYRYDSRDDQYKILDINARVSGVFRLFAGTNDMDVVRVCYLDLTGQHAPATALQPARKWMLENDVIASLRAMRAGRLTLAEWIESVRGVRELHWMARDDPAPFFSWVQDGIRQGALAASSRVARAR